MPKLSAAEVKSLCASEKQAALAAQNASRLTEARADAMDYYNGEMTKDMPAMDGRSRAVSTDVLDTIEGLMPLLMDVFVGGDEIVKFNPVGPEDVQAAEQETDYVNHVFMQENPGFLVLYSFIKDALLSKVGIVKVWWESRDEEQRQTYYDKTDDEYGLLASDPDCEIVEHTEKPDPANPGMNLHDVTILITKTIEGARVVGVPPEEFGIEKNARTMADCNYAFHRVLTTPTKLIAQGYDPDQINNLGTYAGVTNPEELSRDTVDEHILTGDDANKAARTIEVVEHYIRMDYEGKGKACLYRVTTGGTEGEILDRDDDDEGQETVEEKGEKKRKGFKPDITPYDAMPFAAMSPVIVPHRFFGKSLAELVMDIQRIKTALLRGLLDNVYMANSPRTEVPESHASVNTIDDLLVNRPNGIVRTKQPGGLSVIQTPSIAGDVIPVIEYFDQQREYRSGVNNQGQQLDAKALSNQSATAASIAYTVTQSKMKLIARIMAETGIKDLFQILHATLRRHASKPQMARLRGQWVPVDPREWSSRYDMTVSVGLGTGSKSERLAQLMGVIALQKDAIAAGKVNLVSDKNLYNSGKEATKLLGHPDTDAFFTDPTNAPPTQAPPSPEAIKAQAEMAALDKRAQLEQQKSQVDTQHQIAKTQADMALAEKKFELEKNLKLLDAELKTRAHSEQMAQQRMLHGQKVSDGADAHLSGEGSAPFPVAGFMQQMAEMMAQHAHNQTQAITAALAHGSKPKKITKLGNGQYVSETVN